MNDDDYIKHLMGRALAAEMIVVRLRHKLMFWRTAAVGFLLLVIIITLIS